MARPRAGTWGWTSLLRRARREGVGDRAGGPAEVSSRGAVRVARGLEVGGGSVVIGAGRGRGILYLGLRDLRLLPGKPLHTRENIGLSGRNGRAIGPQTP